MLASVSSAQVRISVQQEPMIVVNQVGYQPNSPKLALLLNTDSLSGVPLELVETTTEAIVFSTQAQLANQDFLSGDRVQTVDFTEFSETGEYYWRYGELRSVPFKIASNVYQDAFVTLLRSYYLQRCGVVLDDPVTGIYHAPCHLHDAAVAHTDIFHRQEEPIAAQGGWHDAGDYGKYVATTTITIGRILSLYEQHPQLFWDGQLSIPESDNGIPDVLDEMKFGLDWLLRMQRQDGSVYRKLSGTEWPVGLAPDADQQPRWVYGISTPETAKFAAVMAIAARVFQPIQPAQAQLYLAAAEKSWSFLNSTNEMQVDWVEGDDSGSGKYLASEIDTEDSLTTDIDDRLWAAAELYITTGQKDFENKLEKYFSKVDYTLFEWKDPSALGINNYLFQAHQPVSSSLREKMVRKLQRRAEQALERSQESGFRLANHHLVWGSNKITAEEGITLLSAYQLTQNPAYQATALDQLNYLFGCNPFNQTFVTGIGSRPVQHVHHLFARAKQILIPGLLVGGANDMAQDGIAPQGLGLRSYIDDERSYATNEYAIDYNASLITLIGLLQSIP